jgi:hypothetical protein
VGGCGRRYTERHPWRDEETLGEDCRAPNTVPAAGVVRFSAHIATAHGRLRVLDVRSVCNNVFSLIFDDGVVDFTRGALVNNAGDLTKGGKVNDAGRGEHGVVVQQLVRGHSDFHIYREYNHHVPQWLRQREWIVAFANVQLGCRAVVVGR